MEQQDVFRGSPWGAEPTEDWNRPLFWDDFYTELLAEEDSSDRGQVIHREVDLLIRLLTDAGELPRTTPQTLLDAGCGISLIPHVLAGWGFRVVAIDLSPRAIQVASRHRPTEEELARCVPIWDPSEDDFIGSNKLVEDPARSLRRLREFQGPDGAVTFLVGDWFDTALRPGAFGVVYCRNSLRCSTKSYWRQSLERFNELLAPGGVLLLEHINAIGVMPEVEELLTACGFVPFVVGANRTCSSKYVGTMWPTG